MNKRKLLKKEYRAAKRNRFFQPKAKQVEEYMLKHNMAPDLSSITRNIAFVIDGEVVEIIHCQEKMAAILLSDPEIVNIENNIFPKIGWEYKDGVFVEKRA